ncbi:MAG: tetratricopeptide repeat protein [Myxococcota bacterium]
MRRALLRGAVVALLTLAWSGWMPVRAATVQAPPGEEPATEPDTEAPDGGTAEDEPPADDATAPRPAPKIEPQAAPEQEDTTNEGAEQPSGAAERVDAEPDLPKCRQDQAGEEKSEERGEDEPETTVAEDLDQQAARRRFEESVERYAEVAKDYQEEAHDRIRRSVEEQKEFVQRTYGRRTAEHELAERQRRADAIERFERFVERYPNNDGYTPDAMFRLAELYYERSEVRFADAMEQYEKDRDLYERGKIPSEPTLPRRDYDDSVRMYETMLARFGDSYRYADAVYYLLGYVQNEQANDVAAQRAWKRLVEQFPKSRYAPEVWLRTGEMHFDYGEFRQAADAYEEVLRYPESRFYDKALYKLGWTYFQLYDYDRAIRTFKNLIAWYDRDEAGSEGLASALRKEAVDYLAASLAEDDWDSDGLDDPDAGVDRALSYLSGGEPYERDIIERYAATLVELADREKWQEAVQVYDRLIAMNPMHDEAPEYQGEIIRIYDILREIDAAARERRELANRFGPGSRWWEAHEGDPRLRDQVTEHIEEAMRKRALWHHQRAQELKVQARMERDPDLQAQSSEQYRKAAEAYREYLAKYPNEPASYEMTFFLAESYWYSDQFDKAAPIYEQVATDPNNDDYRQAAAWSSIKSWESIVEERADAGRVPAKAVPGSQWSPPEEEEAGGATDLAETEVSRVEPEAVPESVRRWIEAIDYYADHDFEDGASEKNQALVSYQAGEILYRFKNYPAARERFKQVIACHPGQEVAAYAAANIINSYRDENDWPNLEKWADIADRLELGTEEQQQSLRKEIKLFKLGSMFKRAESLYRTEKYLEAAREFERLADENPDADFADKAYFNAATAYKKEKYYDSAARIFEKLVTDPRYEDSDFAEESLFELAETNKLFFNFDKAVNAYLTLFERYPEGDNRSYALFQAATLQENAGDERAAAKTWERYASLYSDTEEAPGTLYRAAELYGEIDADAEQRRVLREFIERYEATPGQDVLVIDALSTLADLAEEEGNVRAAERYWSRVLREYVARDQEPGSPAAEDAAKARFKQVEQVFADYADLKIDTPNQRRASAIIERKNKLLSELEESYAEVAGYNAVDWTIAAAYRLADIYKDFADTLYNAPYPEGLDPQVLDAYIVQIEDLGLKYEDIAINRYEKAIQAARRLKVTNEWAKKALEQINKYKPAEYPLYKEEIRLPDFDPLYDLDARVPEVR